MNRLTFREFLLEQQKLSSLEKAPSISTHAEKRINERDLATLQKLTTNVFEPWLYYYFKQHKEDFDVSKTGEKGTEFVVELELNDGKYGLVGTYKKDKHKSTPTPFILWITFFKIDGPWFIKRGTDYKFTIKELKETDPEDSITIETSKRKFSFIPQKNPNSYQSN